MNILKSIILIVIIATAAQARQICGPNQEYKECGCHVTCKNFLNLTICDERSCVEDCFCKSYFALNSTGHCVDIFSCNRPTNPCGEDEVHWECGTACPPTCDDPNPECEEYCQAGCVCKESTVRNSDGDCVTVSDCPKDPEDPSKEECVGNQVYVECKSNCPYTCNNCYDEVNCENITCTPGCDCKDGFVLADNTHNVCIQESECQDSSGEEHDKDKDDDNDEDNTGSDRGHGKGRKGHDHEDNTGSDRGHGKDRNGHDHEDNTGSDRGHGKDRNGHDHEDNTGSDRGHGKDRNGHDHEDNTGSDRGHGNDENRDNGKHGHGHGKNNNERKRRPKPNPH
ncbi:Tenascin-like [Oopsacas minuta]|uniref:Tenascin-like n=1 Tax=Oopsacas minuta TaxID=111878 RepID=A0AAV7K6H6_9METZ|nr:Tenascin-like [Oopsacas minuta]